MSLLTSENKTSSGHRFLKPAPKKATLTKQQEEDNRIFNERLRRIYQAYSRVRLSYNPPDYPSKKIMSKEKASIVLQQEYPDLTVKKLLGISRVLFPPGENLYEDSEGKPDPKVRSALYYSVDVSLQRAESVEIGIYDDFIHQCQFNIGRYVIPRVRPQFDRDHNHVNSHIIGQLNRYYIPDTPENIKNVLKRFGEPCKAYPWSVAIAMTMGLEIFFVDNRKYTVTKFEDFVAGDIQDLIDANRTGFYPINRGTNYNGNGNASRIPGLNDYQRWQAAKQTALDKGILLDPKEFREGKGKEKPSEKQLKI